jgi:hypothetical protein
MGWSAMLVDVDTRLEPGGRESLQEARAEALAYLAERIERLGPYDPPTRCAGLRLAFRRVEQQGEIS